MLRISQLSPWVKAVLLLFIGLVAGAWYSFGIVTGSRPASPELRLFFEIFMLITFVWMLVWTFRRREHEDKDG